MNNDFSDSILDKRHFVLYYPNQKNCACEWLEASLSSCLAIAVNENLKEFEIVESFTLIHFKPEVE